MWLNTGFDFACTEKKCIDFFARNWTKWLIQIDSRICYYYDTRKQAIWGGFH